MIRLKIFEQKICFQDKTEDFIENFCWKEDEGIGSILTGMKGMDR